MEKACSILIQEATFRTLKEIYAHYNLDYEYFCRILKESIDTENYSLFSTYLDQMSLILYSGGVSYVECERFSGLLDNAYITHTAKHLHMEFNEFITLETQEIDFKKLIDFGDFYINLVDDNEEFPIAIKVCKTTSSLSTKKHKDMDNWSVSLLRYDMERGISGTEYCYVLVDAFNTKVFVDTDSGMNEGCKYCKARVSVGVTISSFPDIPAYWCLSNYNKIVNRNCSQLCGTFSAIQLNNAIAKIVNQ